MSDKRERGSAPPSISNAEWEVIRTLWENGAMAARDVFAALPDGHGWAYKTVKTLLTRLVGKGAVEYEQVGNSYLYRAVYTRDQMTRKEVRSFVDRVLEGSLMPVLMHFIEDRELSRDEIERLRQILGTSGRQAKSRAKRNDA